MIRAVEAVDCDKVASLIKEKANVDDVQAATGCSALMLAAQHVNAHIFNLLLENKANVNAKDAKGRTAAMLIPGGHAGSNNIQTAARLIALGSNKADLSLRDHVERDCYDYCKLAGQSADSIKNFVDHALSRGKTSFVFLPTAPTA
jgi:hypothetical protein